MVMGQIAASARQIRLSIVVYDCVRYGERGSHKCKPAQEPGFHVPMHIPEREHSTPQVPTARQTSRTVIIPNSNPSVPIIFLYGNI